MEGISQNAYQIEIEVNSNQFFIYNAALETLRFIIPLTSTDKYIDNKRLTC